MTTHRNTWSRVAHWIHAHRHNAAMALLGLPQLLPIHIPSCPAHARLPGGPEHIEGSLQHPAHIRWPVKMRNLHFSALTTFIAAPFTQFFQFRECVLSVRPWGLVLVVREPAIKYFEGGGGISAAGLGGIAAVVGPMGALGTLAGIFVGIIAAALGIYAGVILIVDRGKGVYLTWTWAQLIPGLPQYGLPVVTAIK